jgi:hypothetical protein
VRDVAHAKGDTYRQLLTVHRRSPSGCWRHCWYRCRPTSSRRPKNNPENSAELVEMSLMIR